MTFEEMLEAMRTEVRKMSVAAPPPPEAAPAAQPVVVSEDRVKQVELGIAELRQHRDDINKKLDTIIAVLNPGDENGEGAGAVMKMVRTIQTDFGQLTDVIDQTIDRVNILSGRGPTSKQPQGQDPTGVAKNTGAAGWDNFVRNLVEYPNRRVRAG